MMNQETNSTNDHIHSAAPLESDGLSLGALLAEHRTRKQLTTKAIAAQMKISEHYINALEQEDYETLPGLTFVQGYIRAYARILQLDEDKIEQQLKVTIESSPEKDFTIHGLPKRSKRLSMSMLFTSVCTLIILVIIGLTGSWVYHNHLAKKQASTAGNIILPTFPGQQTSDNHKISVAPAPSGSKSLSDTKNHKSYPPSPILSKKHS